MKTIFVLDEHPVYDRLTQLFPDSEQLPHKSRVLLGNNKLFFQKTEVKFEKGKQYILNSPINSFECWQALFGGHNFVMVEEYYNKGWLKNLLALMLLTLFKSKPFISPTPRTHEFLTKNGFRSTLIPPTCKKRLGAEKREFYLFVGKMIPSKNPLFVLEIAKLMPNEHFIMIGQGELFNEAVGKATGNVSFIPEVIPHDRLLDEYFCRAKALIHPAFKDPIGFVVIEALACQTPVVCSEGVGASDYLPKECVMKGFNAQEWVNAVKRVKIWFKNILYLATGNEYFYEPAKVWKDGKMMPVEVWDKEQKKWVPNPERRMILVDKIQTPEQEAQEIVDRFDRWLATKEGK